MRYLVQAADGAVVRDYDAYETARAEYDRRVRERIATRLVAVVEWGGMTDETVPLASWEPPEVAGRA
ncbi:MAG: hypothetical protein O2895_07070 [Chloroflexi bacterium]|nr:hypothetical protein [Chloroflexota bacterium]